MRTTLAFILDQILQFWPPYRHEHQDADVPVAEEPAAGEAVAPKRPTTQPVPGPDNLRRAGPA